MLAAVGVWVYGGHQYRAGLAAERAATLERQARVERAMQEERDRADAQYRGAVLAREAAQRDLSGVRARLDRLLSEQARRRPRLPEPAADLMEPAPTGSAVLQRATQHMETWLQMLQGGPTR